MSRGFIGVLFQHHYDILGILSGIIAGDPALDHLLPIFLPAGFRRTGFGTGAAFYGLSFCTGSFLNGIGHHLA